MAGGELGRDSWPHHRHDHGADAGERVGWLVELGCDVAQGYHSSRPLPADGLTAWLQVRTRPAERGLVT